MYISGLASGIDVDSLIDQLMTLERQPITLWQSAISKNQTQLDAFQDINMRLANLKTTTDSLKSSTNFGLMSATSSNTSMLSATAAKTATAGTYSITINTLAQQHKVISENVNDITAFTSAWNGSDLNPDINPAMTTMATLNRRDSGLNFIDGDFAGAIINFNNSSPGGGFDVDFSALTANSTFQDVVNTINNDVDNGGQITASINAAGNGILITDNGTDVQNLIISETAGTLGAGLGILDVGVAPPNATKDGGDLNPELAGTTSLSVLNNGAGINTTSLTIRNGQTTKTVDISAATTVQDVLNAINNAGADVTATIDAVGINITANKQNTSLKVTDNGTAGTKLGIEGSYGVLQMKTAVDASYFEVFYDGGYDGDNASLSFADIRDSINAVTNKTFTASILDSRLVIASATQGIANLLQFDDDNQAAILLQADILSADAVINNQFGGDNTQGGELQAGTDSDFTVDGVPVTRTSNTGLTDVIDGVTLNLLSADAGATNTTLTIANNTSSALADIKSFVDQYNSVISFINSLTDYNSTTSEAGTLQGNYMANNIANQLYGKATSLYNDAGMNIKSLFQIHGNDGTAAFTFGSSTTNNKGQIIINETALGQALENDPDAVKNLFAYDSNGDSVVDKGLAVDFQNMLDDMIGTNGTIDSQEEYYNNLIDDLNDRILKFEERLVLREAGLRRQFTSMETQIAQLQNVGSYVSAQLAGLTSS